MEKKIEEIISVKTLENGQRVATKGPLQIVQTIVDGQKFNDCSINHSEYNELVSSGDKRFKDLFIALAQRA